MTRDEAEKAVDLAVEAREVPGLDARGLELAIALERTARALLALRTAAENVVDNYERSMVPHWPAVETLSRALEGGAG